MTQLNLPPECPPPCGPPETPVWDPEFAYPGPPVPAAMGERTQIVGAWTLGDYHYREWMARLAVGFFETNLRLTAGEWSRRPFRLEQWQAEIVGALWGWRDKQGLRKYRRALIFLPRKNGKTELAAGLALLAMFTDGEEKAEIYSLASSRDQSEIVFEKAKTMVTFSDRLANACEITRPSIYIPQTRTTFKPMTGKAEGKHGLNAHMIVADEIHEWKSPDLYNFVHDSQGTRRQPLDILISTAGKAGGFGEEKFNEGIKIRDGVIADDRTFVAIWAADPSDNWRDPEVWRKVNPNLGVSKKMSYMQAAYAEAQQSPAAGARFRCYQLNIWEKSLQRWLAIDEESSDGNRFGWAHCAGPTSWRDLEAALEGERCFTGLDLSATRDLTAIVHFFPFHDEPGRRPAVLARLFKPANLIDEHTLRDVLPYRQWADEGALIATHGDVVDYDLVMQTIREDYRKYNIAALAFDPYNATHLIQELQRDNVPVHEYRQSMRYMSPPSKYLEKLVASNAIHHGDHPVLTAHARHVAIKTDHGGNQMPVKANANDRIDGISALVTAIGMWSSTDHVEEEPYDVNAAIEERGGLQWIG